MFFRREMFLAALAGVLFVLAPQAKATHDSHPWNPQPSKATIMVVHAHPDDEGIFFGGVIPYYTQVHQMPMVHISMTSGDWLPQHGPPNWTREHELSNAAWVYGLRNRPLFPRFKDYPTSTLNQTWDVWNDGVIDGDDVAAGRLKAATHLAGQIRTYKPEVIVAMDFRGESTGHNNHKAAAFAAADAYGLAADAGVNIEGLAAWQTKKLYVHMVGNWRNPGQPIINNLEHLYFDTPFSELGGLTPTQVADLGLAEHVSQGGSNLPGDFAGRRYSEQWGLYASTVGPDTLGAGGRAHGDFFENINLVPEPTSVMFFGAGMLVLLRRRQRA